MRTFTNIFAINSAFGIGQNRCVKMVAGLLDHAALHLDLLGRYASSTAYPSAGKRSAVVAVVAMAITAIAAAARAVARLERLCSAWGRLQPCWQPARRGSVGRRG
jgi:hypothetical protein